MSKTTTPCAYIYAHVTDRIVADLAQGVRPWMKPWEAQRAAESIPVLPLRHSGTPYKGMNILLLWAKTMEKGYTQPIWMTYKQADSLGAHVRKGEHGSLVVYADTFSKTEENCWRRCNFDPPSVGQFSFSSNTAANISAIWQRFHFLLQPTSLQVPRFFACILRPYSSHLK